MLVALPNPGIIASAGRGVAPVVPTDLWRIVTLGAYWSVSSLAEVEMAATIGGANLCTGGTPSVINGSGVTGLFDGNPSSFQAALGNAADRWIIGYNFPSPVLIGEVRLRARDASSAWREAPIGAAVQTSLDGGVTWRTVSLWFNTTPWSAGEVRSIPVGGAILPTGLGRSNARGWGIEIRQVNGGSTPLVGELEFAASPGGATICTGGVPMSSSGSAFADRMQDKAFDNNPASRWGGSSAGYNAWRIGYCRQAPLGDATELRITNALSAEAAQAPVIFGVRYTEDFVNWVEVAEIMGPPAVGTGETVAHAI